MALTFYTAQKMKFTIEDFFSKCDRICSKLRIWLHLLKKSLHLMYIQFTSCVYWVFQSKNKKKQDFLHLFDFNKKLVRSLNRVGSTEKAGALNDGNTSKSPFTL